MELKNKMRHGKPTKANKSGIATASDNVMTPKHIAKAIINKYKPTGFCLEPARGNGNIYNLLPEPKDWCEIKQGRNFFNYHKKVDWIITNPPYSIYDKFLSHCFEVSDNVVLLVPIAKAFKSLRVESLINKYGGLKEIWLIGGGQRCGFAFGFPTGCLYYKREYKGDISFLNDNRGTNFTKSSADDFPYQESLISVKRESADSQNSPHIDNTNEEEANFS